MQSYSNETAMYDSCWRGTVGHSVQRVHSLSTGPGSLAAIADLHGDYQQAVAALQLLKLIDGNEAWIARGVTLVQVRHLACLEATGVSFELLLQLKLLANDLQKAPAVWGVEEVEWAVYLEVC
jgi:hypothetical protein